MAIQDDNTILNKGDLKAYHEAIAPMLGGTLLSRTNVSDHYSTDEKMVGVWTDGKPLYQKTVTFTTPSSGDGSISSGITNIDKVIDVKGLVIQSPWGTSTAFLPAGFTSSNMWWSVFVSSSGFIEVRQTSNYYGKQAWVTIQYTKTTDTAGSATATPGAYDINFPNTWKENTEIYFGNGVYGYRATGTYNTTAGTRGSIVLVPLTLASTTKVMNFGGTIKRSQTASSRSDVAVGQVFTSGTSGAVVNNPISNIAIESNGITMWYKENDTISNIPYDIWVTYTK